MGLLSWLNPLEHITKSLTSAYEAKLRAANDTQRIVAEQQIAALEVQRDVVVAAIADPWWSPRTIMGWSVALFVFKLLIWDTVLGWGITPNPGQYVWWITTTVIGFYFVSRSAETITHALANAIVRKNGR